MFLHLSSSKMHIKEKFPSTKVCFMIPQRRTEAGELRQLSKTTEEGRPMYPPNALKSGLFLFSFPPLYPYVMSCKKKILAVAVCVLSEAPSDKAQWSLSPSKWKPSSGSDRSWQTAWGATKDFSLYPMPALSVHKIHFSLFRTLSSPVLHFFESQKPMKMKYVRAWCAAITHHRHGFCLIFYGKHSMFIYTVIGL